MFTNDQRQAERTGKYGTPRQKHLQDLVTKFQIAKSEEEKEKIAANLANFAYDPYFYAFLRQLNVVELFIDCLTEPNKRPVEFGAGGIYNTAAAAENARIVANCGGEHLQDLVTKFQVPNSRRREEKSSQSCQIRLQSPQRRFLRQLNVLELFIDCLTKPDERLMEFGADRIYNVVATAEIIANCCEVPMLVGCLSSSVRNTVRKAIEGLYYLLESNIVIGERDSEEGSGGVDPIASDI
ncbi:hypothetical protein Cgig2_006028 [Carnegiea gigantea]|uniref:Armadillo repeat-containing protein 7 n=1 Tax=Carnegiea gigantea TaxID=171969 RepID=A0A9Q1L0F9_9CARY|nr:hypothetical protein Cgig2_006028 [Carnegiea gigantea]